MLCCHSERLICSQRFVIMRSCTYRAVHIWHVQGAAVLNLIWKPFPPPAFLEQAAAGLTAASLVATTGPNTLAGGTTVRRASSGYALTVDNTAASGTIGAITVRRRMLQRLAIDSRHALIAPGRPAFARAPCFHCDSQHLRPCTTPTGQ